MRPRSFFIISVAIGSLGLAVYAQSGANYSYHASARPQSADEIEDLGEITPADGPGEESDGKSIPPPEAPRSKFRFNVTTRGDFTTNATLSGDHSSGDFIGLPSLEAGYNVALGKNFTLDLAGRVESAIFAENSDRGFVGYTANATLDYRPFAGGPRIYVSAEPYRYDSFDIGDSITQAIGLVAGTDWGYGFNNGRSLIFGGYNYARYFADPSIDDRNSHRVVVGYAQQLRSNLTSQIFYAWQYNDYFQVSRQDSRHLVGLNLIYTLSERWVGNFGASFVDNDSDAQRASYQSFNASLGLTLHF